MGYEAKYMNTKQVVVLSGSSVPLEVAVLQAPRVLDGLGEMSKDGDPTSKLLQFESC